MMEEKCDKFTFQHLGAKVYNSIEGKDVQERFLKWSMNGRLIAQCFCFDKPFQPYQKDEFVLNFMKDRVVNSSLKVMSPNGEKQVNFNTKVEKVTAEHVPCSILSMEFFDRLQEEGIVRESGNICKCMDDWFEEITISDELRKMLLLEDSERYDVYSDTEREQFLFRLFSHVCIGGAICQYEDSVTPYLDTTKAIYKDLISVQKEPESGNLHIVSSVFKITAQDADGETVYPSDRDHIQDFSYLIVDPLKRHVTVLYHKFGSVAFPMNHIPHD